MTTTAPPGACSWGRVFLVFLRLGFLGFGGPTAHLGLFRTELVQRRAWVSEEAYAALVGFGQLLPGPTSSQVGFLVGYHRAGLWGAVAAFVGFTLPSAVVLALAATFAWSGVAGPWVMGVSAAVVAVVAAAVLGMAPVLCPTWGKGLLAVIVAVGSLLGWGWEALALVGLLGLALPHAGTPAPLALRRPSAICSGVALVLAALVVGWAWTHPSVAAICARAGGLVVGGGHVVLPMLHEPLVAGGHLSAEQVTLGYGLAQFVPGPLFSVAAWIGAGTGGLVGAVIATLAIFAPGLLLALGGLRWYHGVMSQPSAGGVLAALQAGVVGLLAAAVVHPLASACTPVWWAVSAVLAVAMHARGLPPWQVILAGAVLSPVMSELS